MITGLLFDLLVDAVTLATWNPGDNTWRTIDPSAYLDEDVYAVLALILCGESLGDTVFYNLRPDSAGRPTEIRHEMVTASGICNIVGGLEIITLGSGRTFDGKGYTSDSGDDQMTVRLVGQLKASAGCLVSGFDLIALNTTDGLLLNAGTAASRTTVSPPGLPPETMAILGTYEHEFQNSGSGWERSNLYLYPPPLNWSIRSILTANPAATGVFKSLFLPTAFGGDFDYLVNRDGTARIPQASVRASYAVVPARDGGYALDAWTPDASPASLVSGGTAGSWVNVAVPGGQPGDLVLLQVAATDNLGAVRAEFGVDIRQITPNDDHQPYNIRATDTWAAQDYTIKDVVAVILGPGGEFQYQAVNASVVIEKMLSLRRVH